tara:strand:+ start:358 stop:570 length:213 start_codon:yes stop_codon:yes gene_type:complete
MIEYETRGTGSGFEIWNFNQLEINTFDNKDRLELGLSALDIAIESLSYMTDDNETRDILIEQMEAFRNLH